MRCFFHDTTKLKSGCFHGGSRSDQSDYCEQRLKDVIDLLFSGSHKDCKSSDFDEKRLERLGVEVYIFNKCYFSASKIYEQSEPHIFCGQILRQNNFGNEYRMTLTSTISPPLLT